MKRLFIILPTFSASFSVFNPDAVKDVKLYKGGVPAQFGGRISSVLDIRMKEGNSKEYNVTGGLGTVFGRLAVEASASQGQSFFYHCRSQVLDRCIDQTIYAGFGGR